MNFYPRFEVQCGVCGYVAWSKVLADPGKVEIRCMNRGCENHGKRFELQVPPLDGEEVPVEA